ncbi:pr149 [rat cytomegalovirus strain Maastricht]|uniref:Pr149 n=1 Tax=Rat cytomegalovirus (strain Maastricht) TaxID=79700 RepID=Q9DW47_RCMVM|nr:pr149 [rat cytomegalovirus strain Maastricht]AAF99243.1 pr149 [rat cytomegalovirus strain Maastricht]WEG72063.1 membrane protein r149 [Murid betaherpesvirus 2]
MIFFRTWYRSLFLLVLDIVSADESGPFRHEEVFSFLTMSTNLNEDMVVSSVIAFDYSFPLLLVKKGIFGRIGLLNITEDDPEIRYLRSHEEYLQKIRVALDGYTGTLGIRSNCTYDHGKVSCILMHMKEGNDVILKGMYYFDDPPPPGQKQHYYKQILSTQEGEKFRELFSETFETWDLFEKIHEAVMRWKTIHKWFLKKCVPEEIVVEMRIAVKPEPRASCLVKSEVPVLFVASLYTTESDEVRTDMSNLKDNFYGTEVSIPVTPRDGLVATCNVKSQMGWDKKQEMRLRIRGSDYIFEEVAVPWDVIFPKRKSKKMNRWSFLLDILGLFSSTKILLLLVFVTLCAVIRYHLRERRPVLRLYRSPTPPPVPPRCNKKNR